MPWETILSYVGLAAVVLAVVFGRRASKSKQNRLRAEGGRAALAAHLSQSVTTNVDARTVDARHTTADYGPADDLAIERAVNIVLARILGGSDGRIGLAPGDSAPALGLSGVAGGDFRGEGAAVDSAPLRSVPATSGEWYTESGPSTEDDPELSPWRERA